MKKEKKLDVKLNETLNDFFKRIEVLSKTEKKIFIGIVGGKSLSLFYKLIVKKSNLLDFKYWNKINFCLADERLVDLENEDSNFKYLNNILFIPLIERNKITKKQIFKIDISKKNYFEEYCENVKKIDILLIASGEDGHICSLFPNHKLLFDESLNYLIINDSPKPPKKRITISKNMILNANSSFLFFIGKNKKKAFDKFNNKNISYIECPAKLSLKIKNNFIISDFN